MLNLRTLILGQPRTCPQTGLQNEPKYSEKQSEFGTVNWTPYQLGYKNPDLSGYLELTNGDDTWEFEGAIHPKYYAEVCYRLGLDNENSGSVSQSFESFRNRINNQSH